MNVKVPMCLITLKFYLMHKGSRKKVICLAGRPLRPPHSRLVVIFILSGRTIKRRTFVAASLRIVKISVNLSHIRTGEGGVLTVPKKRGPRRVKLVLFGSSNSFSHGLNRFFLNKATLVLNKTSTISGGNLG